MLLVKWLRSRRLKKARGEALTLIGHDWGFSREGWERVPVLGSFLFRRRILRARASFLP